MRDGASLRGLLAEGKPAMPVELGYFTLQVKDIDRAQRFYGALFGWEFDSSPKGAHVRNTKLPIGLDPGGPVNIAFAYFRVEDIEASVRQITGLGGDVRQRIESPAGLMAICTDDQDTVFSLWQPAPGFG
jgi:predicted enzyme related to lactoylglutathione lyase